MGKFIGYRIGMDGEGVPISTGDTNDEARGKAIKRVLSICDLEGQIGVREKPDLTDADFAQITTIVDEWAKRHGIAA